MFQEFTYYLIFGLPLIIYLGLLTIIVFMITGIFAVLKRRGKTKLAVQWHFRLAYLGLLLGVIHSVLGLLAYL